MKKFNDFVNENYKTVVTTDNLFEDNTYVDKVFDHLVGIVCDINHISEKSFKQWDQTRDYIEKYFDNNQELLQITDEFNGKFRYQFCAEYLYEKMFGKDPNITLLSEISLVNKSELTTRLPKPEDNVDLIVQSETKKVVN
jgi:hypothetical protein